MDRAEQAGLGVAIIGHVALFGLLSVGFLASPNPINLKPQPIEVTLSEDVALQSTAPIANQEPPQTALSPDTSSIEETPAPPEPAPLKPVPQPVKKPVSAKPIPAPSKPPTKAVTKPQTAPPQRKSLLSQDMLAGLTDKPSPSKSKTPPAQIAGPAVQSALLAEIRRQVKPYWHAPTGTDVEKLRTTIVVQLSRDGNIIGTPRAQSTTGITDSNRGQVRLHVENAIKAVRLAAPFKLPAEYYDTWKVISVNFDKRLSS